MTLWVNQLSLAQMRRGKILHNGRCLCLLILRAWTSLYIYGGRAMLANPWQNTGAFKNGLLRWEQNSPIGNPRFPPTLLKDRSFVDALE